MIAIPNMEKPKDCSECILADKHLNGLCEAKYYCRLEADNCPLIEIDDELMPPCNIRGCSWYSSTD